MAAKAGGAAAISAPGASSFNELLAASVPQTETVEIDGGFRVVVRELSGRERFIVTGDYETEFERVLAMVDMGLVDPVSPGVDELARLRPEWVMQIARVIDRLSGMDAAAEEESEND